MAEERPELRVGAHVLVQLGSELVTDAEQAILECVKNAYDADSAGCRIIISTTEQATRVEIGRASALARFTAPFETVEVSLHSLEGKRVKVNELDPDAVIQRHLKYTGRISIEDKGDGLTPDQLETSWLVISRSEKRARRPGPKDKTRGGRTPLGDKGLGRLGSMKLGDILLIETATATTEPVGSAQFRWTDCETATTVDEIPVYVDIRENGQGFKGTNVSVLGLRDLQEWKRQGRISELTRSLARLISPFEATSTFPVGINLDGVDYSLANVTNEVLGRAVAEFHFRWGPTKPGGRNVLTARAKIKKRLLTSTRSDKLKNRTESVFGEDGGAAFARWLLGYSRVKGFREKRIDPKGRWFAELENVTDDSEILTSDEAAIADPGPFDGSFYFFHLVDNEDIEKAATGVGVTARLIKDMSGISVLRDGFRIRSQGDWLSLSAGMTSGSTYSIRPENTIGYFALSGEWNYNLVEKSDREGFVEDATYRGFFKIAEACRDFANGALVAVRRGLDEYGRKFTKEAAGAPKTAEASIEILNNKLDAAEKARTAAEGALTQLRQELKDLKSGVAEGSSSLPNSSETPGSHATEIVSSAVAAMEQIAARLQEVQSAPVLSFLSQELEHRQDQAIALLESAAVGLSARGLTHELRTHLTEIRKQVGAIERMASPKDPRWSLRPLYTSIRASCTAIGQTAALIDPMLPRTRATRETFSLREFLDFYVDTRRDAFKRAKIATSIVGPDLMVRMNRSRLLQVVDNLVRNSVFWMTRGTRFTKGRPKAIAIEITPRGFILSDTGPGVNPLYEHSLFEIFVTGKSQKDEGQGLGLFIVTELLETDGCSIELMNDRNEDGRRFRFAVDLAGVLVRG
jgi:signal transduction histidine kinase